MAVSPPTVAAIEERVLRSVELQLAQRLGERSSTRIGLEDQDWVYGMVGRAVAEEHRLAGLAADREAFAAMWRRVYGAVTPLGPLADHLADPAVEEIRINGTLSAFVLREGRRVEVEPPFASEDALVDLVHWYTDGAGSARLDRASPMVTLTLPDGSRLHAALSPPARPLSLTIRRHVPARFRDLADLAAAGFLPEGSIAFLTAAVRSRLNLLVAGGTGTGKTTFTRTLCRLIPAGERLVTIEDQAELHLWRELPDCVSLEGRPANIEGRGAIGIQLLVHQALRMSPDRIVIGEVRGAEALDLLDAMNTGHAAWAWPISASTLPTRTLPAGAQLRLPTSYSSLTGPPAQCSALNASWLMVYSAHRQFQARTVQLHDEVQRTHRTRVDPLGSVIVSDAENVVDLVRELEASEPDRAPIAAGCMSSPWLPEAG